MWAFVAADVDGTQRGELTSAGSRRLSFRLRDGHEASWTASTDAPEDLIDELDTDLLAYRDGRLLFRGRIGPSQDQIGGTQATSQWTAHDYRTVLQRAPLLPTDQLSWTNTDQEQIGWGLIEQALDHAGTNYDIVRADGQGTNVLRDRSYETGKSIGEALDQLSQVEDGFDYAIEPTQTGALEYRVWHPGRGADAGFVLDYGGTLAEVSRTTNPEWYATAVLVTGSSEEVGGVPVTTPVVLALGSTELAEFGRWDQVLSFPDVTVQSTLEQKAAWELAERSRSRWGWSATLAAGRWGGPDDLWLGDTAQLAVRKGRVQFVGAVRVIDIDIDVSDDGEETVRLSLDQPGLTRTAQARSFISRMRSQQRQINTLNRRA